MSERKGKLNYPVHFFDKNELLDRKYGEYMNSVLSLKQSASRFSKATEKFVKATKMKSVNKKNPLFYMFKQSSEFSRKESQRAEEYNKRSNRQNDELDRLKRYVENNRKVLRRRARKNDKLYNQNKKILENMKKKQIKHAKEAHEWFVKHDGLNGSKGVDKQELDFIEFRFIHAAQEEAKYSKEYKSIAKKLKRYQQDYVKQNSEILRRYEEFDNVAQNRIKEQFLCFIEEIKRNLQSKLRNVEEFEKGILEYDSSEGVQKFIEENMNPNFKLEPPHKYEPFIPIYKRSVVQQERMLKQQPNVKKLDVRKLPNRSKRDDKSPRRVDQKRVRSNHPQDLPAHPTPPPKLQNLPKQSKQQPIIKDNKEKDKENRKELIAMLDNEDSGYLKPTVEPIRTPEVMWFENFYNKLTEHDEVISLISQQDLEDELLEEEEKIFKDKKKEKKNEEEVEEEEEEENNWEFGVSKDTIKKAFDMLENPIGRQGLALALNYQRHHPYIVSYKVFILIGELISNCLFKSMEFEDKDVGKMLLNMCQTFYTIKKITINLSSEEENENSSDNDNDDNDDDFDSSQEEKTIFYYQHLKGLSIWRDIRFWIGCFYDTMSQMRMKTSHFNHKWRDLDESMKKEAQREHANMTFGVLTSFVFQMMQAGMHQNEVKKFILKMCEINSLSKDQIQMILLNFEEMLKNNMIPEIGDFN